MKSFRDETAVFSKQLSAPQKELAEKITDLVTYIYIDNSGRYQPNDAIRERISLLLLSSPDMANKLQPYADLYDLRPQRERGQIHTGHEELREREQLWVKINTNYLKDLDTLLQQETEKLMGKIQNTGADKDPARRIGPSSAGGRRGANGR